MKRFILKHPRLFATVTLVAVIAIVAGTAAMQISREPPDVGIETASVDVGSPAPVEMPWPAQGQSAAAVAGVGIIGESPAPGKQQPQPIASLVKVMTAYVILKNHPLEAGQPGPEVEFTEANVQDYRAREANVESVVEVKAGAKMTERDLLRGLLLASGNNLASVLAEWHSGSIEAFVAEMNAEAQALGMSQTFYADAAGVLPQSRSTAHDQTVLANAAITNPTFGAIVREVQANLPGSGLVFNTNSQLGDNGNVGIKTGWTEEAGACFMFASEQLVEDRTVIVVGAVLGQNTLADAFARSHELISSGTGNISVLHVGTAGEAVGHIKADWGARADAVLTQNASLVVLPGMQVDATVALLDTNKVEGGSNVGSILFAAGDQRVDVPLQAANSVEGPDLKWRLTRLPDVSSIIW
jgi:D-alanyl-D-alanine carboxypeptidase (penicillin-binding protein 5/6)